MLSTIIKTLFWIILISLINKQAVAISGHEISEKVSYWLSKEGVTGSPIFSKNRFFKDCNSKIQIKKMFQNYKTIKIKCPDKNGFDLLTLK